MTDRKSYIVAISEPDPRLSPRHTLDDAREHAAELKSRFPKSSMTVWRVETDGSVARIPDLQTAPSESP